MLDARRPGSARGGLAVVRIARHQPARRPRALRLSRRRLPAAHRGARGGAGPTCRQGRRVHPRLPQRLRTVHAPASAGRRRPIRTGSSRGRGGTRQTRPGPRRELPGAAPAEPGRARLLGVLRPRDAAPGGGANRDARVRLASKMVGRWPSGAPLVLAPEADSPGLVRQTTSAISPRIATAWAARSEPMCVAPTRATRSTPDPARPTRSR